MFAYPYAATFFLALANGLGLPVPQIPTLLLLGALASTGQVQLPLVLLVLLGAFLPSDLIWFELGRRRGDRVLRLACRISLEPDSCVRRSYDVFARYGVGAALVQRFVPGIGLVASPILGILGTSRRRFVLLDVAGTGLWAATYLGLGYALAPGLQRLGAVLREMGTSLSVAALVGLACYVGVRAWQRRRFLEGLRMARISPDELHQRLVAGDDVLVVDLRHELDYAADPRTIPGAVRMTAEQIEGRGRSLAAQREVVLYCT
jgi:membrane protein DedA with SNARE-associated domain